MMKILIKNQLKMSMNTIKTQPARNIVGFLVGIIILIVMLYMLSSSIWSIGPSLDLSMVEGVLSFSFLAVIGMTILLGVPQVFKYLYSGSDLEMLFTMPIPTRHIFWIKYIQNFFGIPLLAFIFLATPMTIYGIVTDVSFIYYPVAIMALLAITVIGLSIAYLFNLIIIQIVPASRANEFMTVMSFFAGILVYLMFMLPNIMNNEPATENILFSLPELPKWVPVSWASTAIVHTVNGSFQFVIPFVLLLILTAVILVITTSLVEKGFRTGYIRLSEGSGKKRQRRKTSQKHQRNLRHPIITLGKKEWFSIKRDLREWLAFLPILFFIIFGGIGFLSSGGNLSDIRGYGEISWPIAQGIILFVYTLANGVIAASSIGREGEQLWIIRVLPLSGRQIALGKLWISWLLPFIILVVIEIALTIFLGWTIFQLIFGLLMKAILTIGMSALGLWLGTLGAKYHPTNPQARLNFGVSIILFILSYVYLIIAMIPVAYLVIPLEEIDLPSGLDHGIPGFYGILVSMVLKLLSWKMSYPILMSIIGLLILMIISFVLTSLFVFLSARQIDKGLKINMVSETRSKPLFGRNKSGGSLY